METNSLTSKTSQPEALDAPLFRGNKTLRQLAHEKSESWWIAEGEKKALTIFQAAARHVPAYKDFLRKNGIHPRMIRTIADLKTVPPTDKKNYIHAYPLRDRCWNGELSESAVIAASSGTTGAPTLWPRGAPQEAEAAQIHEQLFLDLYEIEKYKSLIVIGFPMGIYISGVATLLPTFLSSIRHKNITIITPGNNKEGLLKVLPELQKEFEQVVLVGHPFFVKDVIESAKDYKISWTKTKVRTFFCSEGFSEEWRSYVASHIHGSIPHKDFFNTYGTSEMLLVGYESPDTILLKKLCEKNEAVNKSLFNREQTPTIFQYNPALRYIETTEDGELLFTANAGVPLIRFNLHDSGKVLSRKDIELALSKDKVAVPRDPKWHGWNYPYIALYGRSDYTLVFYAANIYPDNIHKALSHRELFSKLTGKFQMEKRMRSDMDQNLYLHLELRKGLKPSKALVKLIQRRVVKTLESVNMEYLFLRNNLSKDLVPRIYLYEYQNPDHFLPGLKPKYIA